MCGRFTLIQDAGAFQLAFNFGDFPADFATRYNVAPSQPVPVVTDAVTRQVEWMRWGLIPSWAKDPTIGARLINARAETLAEKPSFRESLQKRRCLILADGFYEWQKRPGRLSSIPHYFTLQGGEPFVFAGLWDRWLSPQGEEIRTCTIITCPPNELIAAYHDRMPVLLDASAANAWLSDAPTAQHLALLKPYPAEKMQQVIVSSRINSSTLESPTLIEPEKTLF